MRVHILGVKILTFPAKGNEPARSMYQVGYDAPITAFENEKIAIRGYGHDVPSGADKKQTYLATDAATLPQFALCTLPGWCDIQTGSALDERGKMTTLIVGIKNAVAVQPAKLAA